MVYPVNIGSSVTLNQGGCHAEGSPTNSPRRHRTGEHTMPLRPGYFQLPPAEIGATLILVPAFVKGTAVLDLTLWARQHGFGDITYIPAKHIEEIGASA